MKLDFSRSPNGQSRPDSIKNNLAKTSTLYSDTAISLRLQFTKPIEAIAAYYLSLYFSYWNTDVLIRSIAHRAYANNYQGKWELVQEILELELTQPEELEDWYRTKNPYEFYGNILPLAEKLEKRVNYKKPGSVNRTKVKRINRSEYKDKGSRRLPHEYHGQPPIGPEREDRRSRVTHPLVGKVVRYETTRISGYVEEHIPIMERRNM